MFIFLSKFCVLRILLHVSTISSELSKNVVFTLGYKIISTGCRLKVPNTLTFRYCSNQNPKILIFGFKILIFKSKMSKILCSNRKFPKIPFSIPKSPKFPFPNLGMGVLIVFVPRNYMMAEDVEIDFWNRKYFK